MSPGKAWMNEHLKDIAESKYYPLFVSLAQRVCLVIGGGAVGERKIRGLLRYGGSVRLVARDLTSWLREQCSNGRVVLLGERYEEAQLADVDLVFAATSDMDLNRRIAGDAWDRKIWCNMATEPELGTFIVPSVLRRGPLQLAISTTGLSPAAAKLIREKLEDQFGPEWVFFLELMGLIRKGIQAKNSESVENQHVFREIAKLPVPEWIVGNERDRALQAIHAICGPWLGMNELEQLWNELWNHCSSLSPPCATAVERSDT